MAFFRVTETTKTKGQDFSTQSIPFLHKHQCNVCPLNNQTGLEHPHMAPQGAMKPDIYLLGEFPTKASDEAGKPWGGKHGRILRDHLPNGWLERARMNNVVRTHTPSSRDPTFTEIECCRPSIIADIEKTKPKAIIGFGNIPLYWAMKKASGISLWTGRKTPIQVGNHKCWFFPIGHPETIIQERFPKNEELEHLFGLHLKKAIKQIEAGLPEPIIYTEADAREGVEIVTGHKRDDFERVREFIKSCYEAPVVGFDYETHRLRPYYDDAKILSLGIAHNKGCMSFPLDHPGSGFSEKQTLALWDLIEDFIYEAPCRKAVHNVAFELEWTGVFFGRDALRAGKWSCSQVKAYIMDERPGTLSLDFQVIQYFGLHLKVMSDLDRNRLKDEKIENVLMYNGMDAKFHRLVDIKQNKEISALDIWPLYNNILERTITLVLTQMKGVPVDDGMVGKFYNQFEGLMQEAGRKINKLPEVRNFEKQTNKKFNPLSPQDLKRVFKDTGIHLDKLDEEHLVKVDHPLAKLILEFRGHSKTLSTYVVPLTKPEDLETVGIDPENSCVFPDGLLHSIIATTKVRTSRTSSHSPNSQNFGKHYDEAVFGKDYQWKSRKQIKHKNPKMRFVAFDYAGMQARNVAMESRDKLLVDSFWTGYDIHHDWALRCAEIYPKWISEPDRYFSICADLKDKEEVSKEDKEYAKWYRQLAKNNFVFATFFGAHPPTTAERLGVPVKVTEQMYEEFFERFPGIREYHERQKKIYDKFGYVDSLSGYKRHAPVSQNELINSGIQADEAMIVCSAMTELSQMEEDRFQPNMEIHDDLTFIWPVDSIEKNAEFVMKTMTRIRFPWMAVVPIEVEMSVGLNWSDLETPKKPLIEKANSVQLWNHVRKRTTK